MPRDRIEQLTARVRWFDRYGRWIAIAIAVVVSPLLIARLDVVLSGDALAGTQWPLAHGIAMSVMLGVAVWWIAEVAMAWMTAVWETESDGLSRANGLPRAEARPRRK